MPAGFTCSLAERLDRRAALPVREAVHGEPLLEHHVYIAPGGRHLAVSLGADGAPRLEVRDGPPRHGVRPSADILFSSIASTYGASAVGVVLMVVFIHRGARRVPIQYARLQRGRRVYGGQRHYLPLKVNMAGVMPIIFASVVFIIPMVIFKALGLS